MQKSTYKCGRKIDHICKYRPGVRVIIIANDYSNYGVLGKLSSSLNDVTVIWNFFRRIRCVHENQITIMGNLDYDGKIVPWKRRFNAKITEGDQYYFYYSGHGYSDGTLDIPIENLPEPNLSIIDACYSHYWEYLKSPYIISTSEGNVFSMSNTKFSIFTSNLIRILIKNYNYDKLMTWSQEMGYTLKITPQEYKKFFDL